MNMEQIRSFIAIELPPEVKRSLTRFQNSLKAADEKNVKWVEPENMHLTLQFLGNIGADTVDGIIAAIEQASAGTSHFQIEIGGFGAFPNMRRVQTIWVGIEGETGKLARLQKDIGASLTPLGFKPEARPFTPHLTLGRVRDFIRPEDRTRLGQMLEKTSFNARYKVDVASVNLMKSQLTRHGPIYTRLAEVKLR